MRHNSNNMVSLLLSPFAAHFLSPSLPSVSSPLFSLVSTADWGGCCIIGMKESPCTRFLSSMTLKIIIDEVFLVDSRMEIAWVGRMLDLDFWWPVFV
ncbi:hypothetical protein RHMOL_Rhmol09G0271400 [Rhododendron molle]|uniref:Uncharacterized protein n=2 Tax=Rhododendron molle TaxID=49168 RepID=A0ACC0MIZ6_RHOML|nr:hypothetical protein RHMOL_Rhmol09G0271400 [Rhododendron molle]KAI8540546.1 hypothetical protein RHMOL_Rhmol09G0271400 [Rhododendron molle]